MEFYVQGDPFDEPGYDEREFEGYKIAAQPGRNIRISYPQHGALEIMAGCVGSSSIRLPSGRRRSNGRNRTMTAEMRTEKP